MNHPHGNVLCWLGRIASLAWMLYLMFSLLPVIASGGIEEGIQNPFLVLLLIGVAVALAGLRWHLVPATVLTSIGVSYLGAALLHDPVQLHPALLLFTVAVTAGGIVNALAWLNERNLSEYQSGSRHLENAVGFLCGLPGLALFALSLWWYSGLGYDSEWGQDSMFGSLVVFVAIVGAVVFFTGVFGGMWLFRDAVRGGMKRRSS